jgi:hypothetical protein
MLGLMVRQKFVKKEKDGLVITDAGRAELEKLDNAEEAPSADDASKVTLPRQADDLKTIGERIQFGTKKDGLKLDGAIAYIEAVAKLDDLDSIEKAMADIGISENTRRMWLKMYAKKFTNVKISDELREKLELDRPNTGAAKTSSLEVPEPASPKPTRFSVINGEIVGDPDGDFKFPEAIKYLAQMRGADTGTADGLAVQLANLGPNMVTSILTAMGPLLKGGDTSVVTALLPIFTKLSEDKAQIQIDALKQQMGQGNNPQLTLLQARIDQLADEKHKVELDSLRAEFRTGQRTPETENMIKLITDQMNQLREELHKAELARIQAENKALVDQMSNRMANLEAVIRGQAQGKVVQGKYDLMSDGLKTIAEEAKGARQDIRTIIHEVVSSVKPGGGRGKTRTEEERATFAEGLDKGIEKRKAAETIANQLWFSPKTS